MITSPEQESLIIRRAALRGGCVVRSLSFRPTQFGVRAIGQVDCPDGWGAARMLLAAAIEDAKNPHVKKIALYLRALSATDEDFAREVHAFVKKNVRFVRERGEVFQGTMFSLASGAGDCDDHARPVFAIATAGELPARMAFLHHGGPDAQPTHVVTQLGPNGVWDWAETTVDAEYGEHPLDAAERWHLVGERDDLAEEVRIMTEQDLAPIPANYLRANPPDKIDRDAAALARVGFPIEAICGGLTEPTGLEANDRRFREAVAAFQRSHPPLTVDGLIGPKTRRAIGELLTPDEFGMGYLASIGAGNSLTPDLSDEFFSVLKKYAAELGFDPVWMLDVMNSESGIRATAAYRHPPNIATGLIGFVDIARYHVPGIVDNSLDSHDEFAKLDPVTQLRCARDFWLPLKGKATSAANLYQYAFLPASLARGTDDDTVLAAKDGTGYGNKEADFYRINSGYLDVDKSGEITVKDLADRIEKSKYQGTKLVPRYAEALARLGVATPGNPSTSGSGSGPTLLAVTVGVGLIGTLAAAWVAARS